MKAKRFLALCLLLIFLPCLSLAEGAVINLIDHPDAEYAFAEDAELFTIVYPNIHGSDCCIMMYQDEVWMVDCSTDDQAPKLVVPALAALGVTHVDVAFNSHPHDDHITGFEFIGDQASIGKLLIAFDNNHNHILKRTVYRLTNKGTAVERVYDGDVLTMGDGGVVMDVVQRHGGEFTDNDRSAMLMVRFGKRSIFMTGDIENRGQKGLLKNPPACGVAADILKYPHHGHAKMDDELFRLMNPELVIVTAHEMPADDGFAFLKRMDVPGVSTWYGCIRLRTDGQIWVVDRYPDTGVVNK